MCFILLTFLFLTSINFAEANVYIASDSSKITQGPIKEIVKIDPKSILHQLRSVLAIARYNKIIVGMKGSRHSQGGHTIPLNGFLLDFKNHNKIEQIGPLMIRVQSGAIWKRVLEYLNSKGLSIEVMQSDFDFSIGGTISTNVHGWQVNKPPIVDTIEGFHLMLSDGSVVYCTRNLNAELFSAVIGGYGLIGIILDVDLRVTQNKIYKIESWVGSVKNAICKIKQMTSNPQARMFFGRFNLDHNHFLQKVALVQYNETQDRLKQITLKDYPVMQNTINWLFQKTYENNRMRKIRWDLEASHVVQGFVKKLTRNQLLYHSVNTYMTNDDNKTDLLQEYFIPIESFEKFVSRLQDMQKKLEHHLMNITLRQVNNDNISILNYASGDQLCFVMLFRGPKTSEFDEEIKQISIELTSEALKLKGKYYLPYRPYQTKEQFQESYPAYSLFKSIKLKYDPNLIFQNQFYKNYIE